MIYKIPELKKLLTISIAGIIALTAFVWLIGERPYGPTEYLMLFCGIPSCLGTILGILIIRSATIYHRLVDHGVEPDDLVKDQICYLNGEFKAKFLYKDGYSGKFVFKIEGLDKNEHVVPGKVRMYFSTEKEV